ncbi:MAG: hypothetical protein JWM96_157, partial [Alphaproteobacteria bacterium]|nr:hypothetical protein [Alphaproteobacteria bacterium]
MVPLAQPALAQINPNTGVGNNPGVPGFKVVGAEKILVDASGGDYYNSDTCPFIENQRRSYDLYDAAVKAAKGHAEDPDGCPYAINNTVGGRNEPIYLYYCKGWYEHISLKGHEDPVTSKIIRCWQPPANRKKLELLANSAVQHAYDSGGDAATKGQVVMNDAKYQGAETVKKIKDEAEKQKQAYEQCFSGTFDSIADFWSKKREVACIKSAAKAVKFFISDHKKQLKLAFKAIIAGFTKSVPQGSSPGPIVGTPSAMDLAKIGVTTVDQFREVIALGIEAQTLLKTLLNDCNTIIPGLKDLKDWKNRTLNNMCQAAESLIERQLTQCIRINIGAFDLKLPEFAILLQCPVNISIDISGGPNGFRCFTSASVTNPLQSASFGNTTLFSGSGGLKNLFDPGCFKPASGTSYGQLTPANLVLAGTGGETGGTRIPGVTCGTLDNTNVQKKENYRGRTYLKRGSAINGWAIGGSEPISSALNVTRCDLYDNRRLMQTAYVYGDGSSCALGPNGFMDAQKFETNTACYGGGYTPLAAANIPDACMYPAECIDASGSFSPARAGTVTGCPAGVNPAFDATRT